MTSRPQAGGSAGTEATRSRAFLFVVALTGVTLVALIALIASGSSGSNGGGGGEAEVLSADSLRDAVAAGPTPVYWAGERPDVEFELSRPDADRTYVRYLTGGAEAGDPRADFLTVGTYAQANPIAALRARGRQPGAVLDTAPGHATVYYDRTRPHSVYLAYPGVEVEIEVYDPNFTRALELVDSGQIVTLG